MSSLIIEFVGAFQFSWSALLSPTLPSDAIKQILQIKSRLFRLDMS
jgi:hypothetical protein